MTKEGPEKRNFIHGISEKQMIELALTMNKFEIIPLLVENMQIEICYSHLASFKM